MYFFDNFSVYRHNRTFKETHFIIFIFPDYIKYEYVQTFIIYINFPGKYNKNITPKIICEKYREQSDSQLLDYKFICCNGIPRFVWIDTDRFTEHKHIFYDFEWKRQPFGLKFPIDVRDYPKPNNFVDKMIELARILQLHFL